MNQDPAEIRRAPMSRLDTLSSTIEFCRAAGVDDSVIERDGSQMWP